MSLYGLAHFSDNPYHACKNGYPDVAGYKECEKCEMISACEIFEMEYGKEKLNEIVVAMRESDIKYKATYYQDDGFWYNDERFDKVEKLKCLKGTTPRFDCFSGMACHPDFWKCEKCIELSTCEIGQYRMAMKAEKMKAAKEKSERLARAITDFFKKIF